MEDEKKQEQIEKETLTPEEMQKLINVDLSVRDAISEKGSELIETKYYKELEINTKYGPTKLNDVFVTIERNKEGDMEYHFRWVKENENGEETIEEKMMIDKDGKAYGVEGLKEILEDQVIDVDTLFEKNDKEKDRLVGIVGKEEREELDKERQDEQEKQKEQEDEEKEPKNDEEEEKKAEQDLKEQGEDLHLTNFRKITDHHLQERMPGVFRNSQEYAMAYSEAKGSFVILQKQSTQDENGKSTNKWVLNENVQTSGTNFKPIMSVDESGNRVEKKVPMALLKTNSSNQEIAVTLDAKNQGELDIETVTVMKCNDRFGEHEERLGRSVGMEGQGNELAGGEESEELRNKLNYSGNDEKGNPGMQHNIVHGAKESIKDNGDVSIDENTTMPGCKNLTYGKMAEITGKNVAEILADEELLEKAAESEEKIEQAAKENKMTIGGYMKELIKADGRTIDEKIEEANLAIMEQYMGNNERKH